MNSRFFDKFKKFKLDKSNLLDFEPERNIELELAACIMRAEEILDHMNIGKERNDLHTKIYNNFDKLIHSNNANRNQIDLILEEANKMNMDKSFIHGLALDSPFWKKITTKELDKYTTIIMIMEI